MSSAVRSNANSVLMCSIHVRTRSMIAREKEALTSGEVIARLRSQLHGCAVGFKADSWPMEELDHAGVHTRMMQRPRWAVGRDLLILEVCAGLHRHVYAGCRPENMEQR